jgi:tRNA pseudouridine55 synthase
VFGEETDTLDPEGAVIAHAPAPTREAVTEALAAFRGDIMQQPPAYSALHVAGERASVRARRGETVALALRPVTVYSLEVISWEGATCELDVRCSAGTYIRALARDIALAAGSRGRLEALCRTEVAGFSLADAVSGDDAAALREALRPIDRGLFGRLGLPVIEVDAKAAAAMRNGRPLEPLLRDADIPPAEPQEQDYAVFAGNTLVAVIARTAGSFAYRFVQAEDEQTPPLH